MSASPPAPFRSNLARRVLTAVVALPALIAVFFIGPPLLGVAVIALFLVLGLVEFYELLRAGGIEPLRKTGVALLALTFSEGLSPAFQATGVWPLATLVLFCVLLLRADDLARAVPAAAGTLLGAAYLGALGGTMAGLLLLPPLWQGPRRVALLMAIAMTADCLAFFTGRVFGRHKLAPRLSPGKTVEGALGGLAGGMAGALLMRAFQMPWLDVSAAALLGAVVAALGIAGDLSESLLKRWAGVKDSGTLFPGHGGVLDRLDSLLFGAPALYYWFSLFPG